MKNPPLPTQSPSPQTMDKIPKENWPEKIGLLAGSGNSPLLAAQCANQQGIPVVSILFSGENQGPLEALSENSYSIGVGQISKIIKTLHAEKVKDVLLMGKINKEVIFNKKAFDLKALKLLAKMKMRDDGSFQQIILEEFQREGIRVLDQTLLLRDYLPQPGVLGRKKADKRELKDIAFGFPIAKKIADMEIGQTIVVKDGTVVAVESMEGSDRAIQRGCEIAGPGAVIIKVSRPRQDWRFDVPTIGLKTIQTAAQGKAAVLAVEAGRMLFVEKEEGIRLADSKKLALVAYAE